MVYLYNFCFYFSLRLGGIIIGIISLLQGVFMVTVLSIGFSDLTKVSTDFSVWKKENNLIFLTPFFDAVEMDAEKYLTMFLTIFSFYTLSCVMLIYGSYTCNTYLMYPYLAYEFLRIISLFSCHVMAMMIIKQNVVNLGLLIGLTVSGGFILLGLGYMWVCILSLLQIIKELVKEIEITSITNFPQKPNENKMYYNQFNYRY